MCDAETKEAPGYALLRERERLAKLQPELVAGYRSFLRDFAQFRETQRQFGRSPRKGTPEQSTFAARLK